MVRQNLPSSLATSAGHLNRYRQKVKTSKEPSIPAITSIPSDETLHRLPQREIQHLAKKSPT
jgi:hypothetical protein